MLGKYLKINGIQMPNPNPGTFKGKLNPTENIYFSEAGTRKSNVVRLDRPSWECSFNCSGTMKDKILDLCKKPSVVCSVDGVSYEGTLREKTHSLVKDSEFVKGTQGLWVVSVEFEGE